MFICSKLRQNLSEMEVSTFERIQRVIWDHLLPFKGEIIQKLLCDSKRGETSMLNTQFIAHIPARVHPGMLDYITIKCE